MESFIAWGIVLISVAWIVRSVWRAATGKSQGCGGGCAGCCGGTCKPGVDNASGTTLPSGTPPERGS